MKSPGYLIRRVVLFSLVCLVFLVKPGLGASYPNRAITVICPWAPGGGTDRLTRYLADQLRTELGVPVVVVVPATGVGRLAVAPATPPVPVLSSV